MKDPDDFTDDISPRCPQRRHPTSRKVALPDELKVVRSVRCQLSILEFEDGCYAVAWMEALAYPIVSVGAMIWWKISTRKIVGPGASSSALCRWRRNKDKDHCRYDQCVKRKRWPKAKHVGSV